MAILWNKTVNGTKYEVRTAGQTRRLYTDGVFHSQYNPRRAYAGGVWDLLMLPALFYEQGKIQRVLVLGVGGGAVIQQLQRHIQPKEIIGIELNPVHIQVAKKFFGIDKKTATLYEADAIQWLKDYKGPPFDMIIEDLFTEQHGEPLRVIEANSGWFNLLAKHLTPHGLLVMNFMGKKSLRDCAWFQQKKSAEKFSSAFMFTLKLYENAVAAFLKQKPVETNLREIVQNRHGLKNALKNNKLEYRMRVLRNNM